MDPAFLCPEHPGWPARLSLRLGGECPARLHTLGDASLLAAPLTALFCSARCPGEAILRAYDQAARWRDTGRAVIGGFHSPMEHECLRLLLRGPQPVVVGLARGLPARLPPEFRPALASGRLLLLTSAPVAERRATRTSAARRNLLVAALATEVWFAHIAPGGQMERLARRISAWPVAGAFPGS